MKDKIKVCSGQFGCGKVLPLDDFHKKKNSLDGHQNICKICRRELDKKIYTAKKEFKKQQMRDWYSKNKDKKATQQKKWDQEHKSAVNAIRAKRRARKLKATPANADYKKIQLFYKESQALTKVTGTNWHVDHVMPLSKGGLHHQDNLRVITQKENGHKSDHLPTEIELSLAGKLRFVDIFEQLDLL